MQENSSDSGTGKRQALDPAWSETLLAGIQREGTISLLFSRSTKFSRQRVFLLIIIPSRNFNAALPVLMMIEIFNTYGYPTNYGTGIDL